MTQRKEVWIESEITGITIENNVPKLSAVCFHHPAQTIVHGNPGHINDLKNLSCYAKGMIN